MPIDDSLAETLRDQPSEIHEIVGQAISEAVAAAGTNLADYTITYANGKLTVVAVPGVVGLQSVFIGGTGAIIDSVASARGLTGTTAQTVARISSNGLIALYGAKIHGNVRSTHGRVSVRTASRVHG
jgi:hypothetical protein